MKNNKGFSLIEIMIAVAIIGIITLLAHPYYKDSQRRAKIAEGVAAIVSAHSNFERYRLINNNLDYDVISLTESGVEPKVHYSNEHIYTITYRQRVYRDGKDEITFTDELGHRLIATAAGDWLDENHKCFTLSLHVKTGERTPVDC